MSKNLIIVESPAKAKTINKFLGSDYIVTSCYGHIRDLPDSGLNIDIENNFEPNYVVSEDKEKVIKELKKLGVYIAIDDFGTGYSSLRYLKQLPIDTLKIDQSFIKDMTVSDRVQSKDKALVEAIIMLGHNLGMHIIAEGVELQGQLDFLRASHCEEIQGYLFCRPLPTDEVEHFMAEGGKGDGLSARLLAI